jgi:hypothetical protein
LVQVEPGEAMSAVVHIEAAVLDRRSKRDALAAKCLAEAPGSVLEVDEAVAGANEK